MMNWRKMILFWERGFLSVAALLLFLIAGCATDRMAVTHVTTFSTVLLEEPETMIAFSALVSGVAGLDDDARSRRLAELTGSDEEPLALLPSLEVLLLMLRLEVEPSRSTRLLERTGQASAQARDPAMADLVEHYRSLVAQQQAQREAWEELLEKMTRRMEAERDAAQASEARRETLSVQVDSLEKQIEELKNIEMLLDERQEPLEGDRQ